MNLEDAGYIFYNAGNRKQETGSMMQEIEFRSQDSESRTQNANAEIQDLEELRMLEPGIKNAVTRSQIRESRMNLKK